EAFGYLKRVIVTPAVYPRLVESLHFDIQSTGQKSHCVNTVFRPSQCYVLIRQSDSTCPYQFQVGCLTYAGKAEASDEPRAPVLSSPIRCQTEPLWSVTFDPKPNVPNP